jgi:hypothetical protein
MMPRVAISITILLLVVGCRTVVTPKQVFFDAHPELAKSYVQFDQTSLALMEETAERRQNSIERLLAAVRERASNDCPAMLPGVEGSLRTSRLFYQGELERVAELRHVFDERTDNLIYYHYTDGDDHEWGWLILRRTEIVKKLPIATTFGL